MKSKETNPYKTLVDQIKNNLNSQEFSVIETALQDLCKLVNKNSSRNDNPLAAYFDAEPSVDSLVKLPLLDGSFISSKSHLTIETILDIIKMSLKSVSRDNYNITILSIQEIIERKDVKAQKKVIQLFKKACGYYDFGHRELQETVLDTLYDHLFKAFELDALISLLSNCDIQMLSPSDGDNADHLFISAFPKCIKNSDFKKLATAFFRYKREVISTLGTPYFEDLQNKISKALADTQKPVFDEIMELKAKEYRIFDLLASDKKEDILELVQEIGKKERKKIIEEDGGIVADKILSSEELSKETLIKALDGFIKQKEKGCTIKLSLHLLQKYGKEALFHYIQSAHTKENEEDLFFVICNIIEEVKKEDASSTTLKPWYEFAQLFGNGNDAQLFSKEIAEAFTAIKDKIENDEPFSTAIDHLKEIVSWVKNTPIEVYYLQLNATLMALAQRNEEKSWEAIKETCLPLFKILEERQILRGLHIAIIAVGKTNDLNAVMAFENYVPKDTNLTRLTFNLACIYAMFSKKEEMLNYIRRSIELGKPKSDFLEDTDFKAYLNDKDFLEALATK